jgi:hypothetical protein
MIEKSKVNLLCTANDGEEAVFYEFAGDSPLVEIRVVDDCVEIRPVLDSWSTSFKRDPDETHEEFLKRFPVFPAEGSEIKVTRVLSDRPLFENLPGRLPEEEVNKVLAAAGLKV